MHVIIAGAGIGGLCTALCCLKQGLEVTLLEQAPQLREVGAGVQISSNGSAVLRELGLVTKADTIGVRPESMRVIGFEDGEIIADMPLGRFVADRYGMPFYQFHRSDLLELLASQLPAGILRLGCRVEGFEQDPSGVTVLLNSAEPVKGDVLIGADGIHSVIRGKLVGDAPTTFSGKLVWRALIPADRIATLDFKDRFYGWAGPDRMVWAYWVRPKALFNFGAVVPSHEVRRESWDDTADLLELRSSLLGANRRLKGLVDSVERAFVTGLFDRDPLPTWSVGRVTLLGDSAHPMLPYLAQGACQAMEDGLVLSHCLARFGKEGVVEALTDYELRRRPRTTKVQSSARAAHLFWTEADPVQTRGRNGRMRGLAQVDPLATTIWRWLYSYDGIKAASGDIVPDKRGKRKEYVQDSVSQRKAWNMWHDMFTSAEEARGIAGLRDGYDRFFRQFMPKASTRTTRVTIGFAKALWVEPAQMDRGRVILHLHGGAAFGSAGSSVEYAERLAEAVNGRCLTLDYRLAPEHPFPAALDDAIAAYRFLLSERCAAEHIWISGESSGGGLAVSLSMGIRDLGLPQSAGIVVLSPLVDCTLSSESIHRLEGEDPIIDRDFLTYMTTSYFQGDSPSDPRISALYGNFSDLPPMLVQAAELEVLVDDAKRLATAAKDAGAKIELQLYPERLHIFSVYPFLESSEKAMRAISEFTKRKSYNEN